MKGKQFTVKIEFTLCDMSGLPGDGFLREKVSVLAYKLTEDLCKERALASTTALISVESIAESKR